MIKIDFGDGTSITGTVRESDRGKLVRLTGQWLAALVSSGVISELEVAGENPNLSFGLIAGKARFGEGDG